MVQNSLIYNKYQAVVPGANNKIIMSGGLYDGFYGFDKDTNSWSEVQGLKLPFILTGSPIAVTPTNLMWNPAGKFMKGKKLRTTSLTKVFDGNKMEVRDGPELQLGMSNRNFTYGGLCYAPLGGNKVFVAGGWYKYGSKVPKTVRQAGIYDLGTGVSIISALKCFAYKYLLMNSSML